MDWLEKLEAQNNAKGYVEKTYGKDFKVKLNWLPIVNGYMQGWFDRGNKVLEVRTVAMSENVKKNLIDTVPAPGDTAHPINILGLEVRVDNSIPAGTIAFEDEDGKLIAVIKNIK